jgi:two-component system, OmpR family, response regulator
VKILVVDDCKIQLNVVARVLTAAGYHVLTSPGPMDVPIIVMREKPRIVLFDLDLPAVPGEQAIRITRKYAPRNTLFVIYSANEQIEAIAGSVGADGWISKRTLVGQVPTELKRIIERQRAAKEWS